VAKTKCIDIERKKGIAKLKTERAKDLQAQDLTSKEIANALNFSERPVFHYLAS
jgi:DNA-binding CsgD family transcriptional regulator